ncbi:MAG TPA: thiamine pyrophosphate-binding protein [Caulobacteraceae bacterium]|jgi:acetolactate synthase-1/2/3 large subunit|nr:thiamine pyrophosphate-binding protein [Caulobacteraceae bacterium]
MSTSYTVSDLVAEFLARCEVETAFGVVSVHNVPMLDAVARSNRIRFVMARGELGASHMADGYGRASGKLGVLFSSTGPGASNAATGLVEGRFASTPMLHITGQSSTRFVDRDMGSVHDIPDQLGLMASAGKASYRVRTPSDAFAVLRQAAADALSFPRGPVTVEVPIDVQSMAVERPAGLDDYLLPTPAFAPAAEAELAMLADRVANARRPVLWVGRGAMHAGPQIQKLVELGFGMVTSLAGRAVVSEDHPRNLGALNGGGMSVIEEFYATCDLMLVLGSRVRAYDTGDLSTKLPANLVQIDVDPRADGRTYANTGFVNGDVAQVIDELLARAGDRVRIDPDFPAQFERLKTVARASFKASLGPYASFAEQLRAVVPRDAIWARDITMNNSSWGHRLFQLHHPSTNIYPISGGIGQGLCLGVGAALAPGGRKTVVLIGDGGLQLNLGELWTAVQENLDITIIVGNDNGYGVIRQIQDKVAGGRRNFDDLLAPKLEALAEVAGIPFWRVTAADHFGDRAAQALAVRGPSMVEIDMIAVGEHPPYYPIGPRVKTVEVPA